MPISSDLSNPRNFITKISRYNKVLLPISIEMAKRNLSGIWNFTNPGVVSHNEILYSNFTLEEQAKVIVAARSNNEMDASKLKKEFPELMSIKESLVQDRV
ncbi:trifunctional UDP-glucose 4 6-dehydratase/UDP-4-keto-6-deoxy-d-glucose 3 5-epimerase/UDP-4-keto-l-rhamnose-reductase rhm1 [Phtheirospermum japonicum]|uniref:Trifunctional UDP-glucose 4 6-dehydratase/UDP-4-keto-6-deoxy-d-glucose 3 5-epimerase/UDP-4-keto-l-rhamnose-reductase rhm1 n=1 Tax=Phtheirospermum japonicum TaxID=374723 RepID=A0A830DEM4_9LAMI|nr:trifunctional UDP-glucose 4 6-dehydratase/UDP-4-keto-6-deoxy-d-glucose 3 5-epimerase/UDP-4-keto-l-rhamnose-reductase rhm1 [Phtheirospermum japonicum]